MKLSHTLLLTGVMLLTACSQTLSRQSCLPLADAVNYCLAPISNPLLDQRLPLSETQKISIAVKGSQHELMGQVEITPQQLTLVGLAPLGQALFTVQYDGKQVISEQSALLGKQFKAEYLLTMLQLIYWPTADINQHLQGAHLISYACGQQHCRSLLAGNDMKSSPLITIRYSNTESWHSQVNLTIPAADFTLELAPL